MKGTSHFRVHWAIAIALTVVVLSAPFATARVDGNSSDTASPPVSVANFSTAMRVVLLPDKTLMGVYLQAANPGETIAARYSKDDGHTWTDPVTLLKLPVGVGTWGGPEVLADRSGELQLFLLKIGDTTAPSAGEAHRPTSRQMHKRRINIWHTRSSNGRSAWQPVRRIWDGYTGSLNSVIQLRNGRIVLPFSFLTDRSWRNRGGGFKDFTFVGRFDSTTLYSDDDGSTWRLSPSQLEVPVPDIDAAYGAVEPVVLQLKDGRVWMLIRTQVGRFYESFSSDGITWSTPQPTSIISSDSPAGLVRLADGRILLLWNDCQRYPYAHGGRQVLHGAISSDEGKTWRGYREVVRDPLRNQPPPPHGDFGTAYPFPTLTADGKVLLHTGQGKGRNFLVLLDPRWLEETHQATDFSRGLDDWSIFGTKGPGLIPEPGKPGVKVLRLRKTDAGWPSGAVWNFPDGAKGTLRMKVLFKSGFKGALIGLTDQFSPPFDSEDRFYNLFNVGINAEGQLANGAKVALNRWHTLDLRWDCEKRICQVIVDGRKLETLPLLRATAGVCYLRLRPTALSTDEVGMLVESVSADVSAGWTH